jgi:diguanylate cyclase (GGDEF)-like protein
MGKTSQTDRSVWLSAQGYLAEQVRYLVATYLQTVAGARAEDPGPSFRTPRIPAADDLLRRLVRGGEDVMVDLFLALGHAPSWGRTPGPGGHDAERYRDVAERVHTMDALHDRLDAYVDGCGESLLLEGDGMEMGLREVEAPYTDEDVPVYVSLFEDAGGVGADAPGTALSLLRQLAALRGRVDRLLEEAVDDEMTGLRNRRYFDARLVEELSRANRRQEPFSLVILTALQGPDARGLADDAMVQRVAHAVRDSLRDYDICCRSGEYEFMLLLPGATLEDCAGVVARLRQRVAQDAEGVTSAVGTATWPVSGGSVEDVIEEANISLAADFRRWKLGEVEIAGVPPSMVEDRRDRRRLATVWFEGIPQALEVQAADTSQGLRFRMPVSFLRKGSPVYFTGPRGKTFSGTLRSAVLGPGGPDHPVPVLQVELAAPAQGR